MTKIFGALIGVALFITAMLSSGSITNFLDIPSIFMVFGITWSLMTFRYGKKAFTFWWLHSTERSPIAKWSGKTCIHVGIVSAILGYIQIGNELTDLNLLGPALSVATITIFYSYLCYLFLFFPFTDSERKAANS